MSYGRSPRTLSMVHRLPGRVRCRSGTACWHPRLWPDRCLRKCGRLWAWCPASRPSHGQISHGPSPLIRISTVAPSLASVGEMVASWFSPPINPRAASVAELSRTMDRGDALGARRCVRWKGLLPVGRVICGGRSGRLGGVSGRASPQVRPVLRGPQVILQVLPALSGIGRVVVAATEPADVKGDLGQVVPHAVQR